MHFSSNHFELVWRSRGIAFYYYQQFKLQVGYSNITAFCWKFLKSNLKTIRWTFGKLGCDASSTIMFFIGCSSIYIMCIISIQRLYIILMSYYINNCKNGSFILIFNFKGIISSTGHLTYVKSTTSATQYLSESHYFWVHFGR